MQNAVALQPKSYRTWPWILAVLVLMLIASFVPSVNREIIRLDTEGAYWFNDFLGQNEALDLTVAHLNSQSGDKFVAFSFLMFFLLHSLYGGNKSEIRQRMAFWTWMVVLFIFLYQSQRVVEFLYSRDSPGRALDDWFSLSKVYDIKTKTRNSHCFPSGHAMAYYFVAFITIQRYWKTGVCLLLVALTVPTTRIATGAHWPSDIFLGSLPISFFFAALVYETRLRSLYAVAYDGVAGALHLAASRGKRPLRERLGAAWRELLDDTPQHTRLIAIEDVRGIETKPAGNDESKTVA